MLPGEANKEVSITLLVTPTNMHGYASPFSPWYMKFLSDSVRIIFRITQGLVTPVMLSCSDGMHDFMKPSCLPASSIAAAISHSHIRNHLHVFAMHYSHDTGPFL